MFVSANYRLGALGTIDLSSLSTQDVAIEGNLFLRDLVLALQWVHWLPWQKPPRSRQDRS